MKHTIIVVCLTALVAFLGCCSDRQAGVVTDTHTKTALRGVIHDSANIPRSARIRIVPPDFSVSQDESAFETFCDSSGFFEFDSIPPGNWHLLVTDTSHNLATQIRFTHSDSSNSDIDLGVLVTSPGAKLLVDLRGFDISTGDVVFIPGTDAGIVIDNAMISSGTAYIANVPATDSLSVILEKNMVQNVISSLPEVQANGLIWLSNSSIQQNSLTIVLKIPDSIIALGTLVNMPFPLPLPSGLTHPCLVDEKGMVTPLDSTGTTNESVLYWGTFKTLTLSENANQPYRIIENCDISSAPIARMAAHMNDASDSVGVWGNSLWLDSNSAPYMFQSFYTFVDSANIGAAFWIKADGAQQRTTNTQIFDSRSGNSGIRIQQRAGLNSLQLRLDTKDGDYGALFGISEILDGKWHHYAFSIYGNHILVLADGNVVTDSTFNAGSGFTNSYNSLIGNIPPCLIGSVDEFMFFDGSQSTAWWKVFYALQTPTIQWLLE